MSDSPYVHPFVKKLSSDELIYPIGSWYKALLFYNHGNIFTASEKTKAYARRIINAK
jgi:hypothetical protein